MTGLIEHHGELDRDGLCQGLTGNLCRCTGYVPIVDAGLAVGPSAIESINSLYPPALMLDDLACVAPDSVAIESTALGRTRRLFSPASLAEALAILKTYPQAKVVSGATDIGVQLNKGIIDPDVFLDLNRVAALGGVELEQSADGGTLLAGARATWSEIEEICREAIPEFQKIVSVFGSPQIRHVGTIGGNIINASPIADSLPLLFVAEAALELASAGGTRTVPITEFYHGYKKFDLRPGELLTRIRVPLPAPSDLLQLFKISRRRDLDISTFTAAIRITLEGDSITDARIAFGAVGPTVLRARETEAFLRGRPFDEDTMFAAGDIAVGEVRPISDVRGSADYRFQLTRNVLVKFYHEQALAAV
jgi:xanthine dehydrogenase small subunit